MDQRSNIIHNKDKVQIKNRLVFKCTTLFIDGIKSIPKQNDFILSHD